MMKRGDFLLAACLGLTTFQVLWGWIHADRQLTRASLMLWVFLLGTLALYYWACRTKIFSGILQKAHRSVVASMNTLSMGRVGVFLAAGYAVWYVYYMWGTVLIGKDFGIFFYRYVILDDIFPSIVAYNPMLNGGTSTMDALTSGSINLFLVTYPITALFSLEAGFMAQPLLVALLLPGSIYLSGRLVSFSHAESLLSAAFGLVLTPIGHMGLGQMFFHGTLPYIFSCELVLVIFALSYRIFVLGSGAVWGIPLIILLGSLASLHSVFLVNMGPVALITVFFGRIPSKQKVLYSALIGLGLLAINGGWLYKLLSIDDGRFIGGFVTPSSLSLMEWLSKLENNFFGFQVPLVIASALGLRQLLRDGEKGERRYLGGLLIFAIVYYALLSSLGYFIVALMQPMRFTVPLSVFLSFAMGPSWTCLQPLWTQLQREATPRALMRNMSLAVLAVFVCIPYIVFFVGFPTRSATTYEFARWLKENAADTGRVFIFVPDEGAHKTALESQIPFYQVSAQASLIGVPTSSLPKQTTGWIQEIGECLMQPEIGASCRELYNIRYAVTLADSEAPPSYKDNGLPGFRLVKTIGTIQIHESTQKSSYFLIGRGEARARFNRITVSAKPSDFVVLKYFWSPKLRTEPPLAIEPYLLPNGRAYIKVQTNFESNFDIVYR